MLVGQQGLPLVLGPKTCSLTHHHHSTPFPFPSRSARFVGLRTPPHSLRLHPPLFAPRTVHLTGHAIAKAGRQLWFSAITSTVSGWFNSPVIEVAPAAAAAAVAPAVE